MHTAPIYYMECCVQVNKNLIKNRLHTQDTAVWIDTVVWISCHGFDVL